jgi:hypothetical protein
MVFQGSGRRQSRCSGLRRGVPPGPRALFAPGRDPARQSIRGASGGAGPDRGSAAAPDGAGQLIAGGGGSRRFIAAPAASLSRHGRGLGLGYGLPCCLQPLIWAIVGHGAAGGQDQLAAAGLSQGVAHLGGDSLRRAVDDGAALVPATHHG